MGRWKPPSAKSSPYITAAGYQQLKRELKQLWIDRREVVAAITAAAAEGDRSENAEYIYRKKQLREMDRRIRYLSRRIDEVQPVGSIPAQTEKVFFGARVTVGEQGGKAQRYRIVGADEIDPGRHWISVDSPLARALLGKALGDFVDVDTPSGPRTLEVIAVDYGTASDS
jgi:transcription elongation factor GreB